MKFVHLLLIVSCNLLNLLKILSRCQKNTTKSRFNKTQKKFIRQYRFCNNKYIYLTA